jgi:L-fuconolactonase
MNIDAHFHAWHLARGDYGWLTPSLAPIYRDVEIEHWARQADAHHIHAGVLVQAAPSTAETLFLLEQAKRHPGRVLGVIGWVDLLAADAPAQIEALSRQPLLKGLRPMLQDIAQTDWIAQAAAQAALSAMAEAGLVFDALIQPRHLPVIADLTRCHRNLRIVIDHGAKPDMRPGSDSAALQLWRQGLQALAAQGPRVMCKLSGLWTEAPAGQPCEHVRPWAQALLEIWGPGQLIWGSDWPVLELAGSYAQWRDFSLNLLGPLAPAEQQAVLGGNARAMYRLEP